MNSVTEQMLGHILHACTSVEIWTTFAQIFPIRSRARLLHSRNLLQTTKKGASFIEEYLLTMIQHDDSLIAAGHPITDEELALYILGGLGSEYEYVVVNLTSRADALTLQEVHFMLQTHELCIQ